MAYTCSSCSLSSNVDKRLPSGWKRFGERVLCTRCTKERYVLRAIALPVAYPLNVDWKGLDAALKRQWRMVTAASNWMMTELYARDFRRTTQSKIPRMRSVYLYPELRERFPELPSGTVAALESAVLKKYKAIRYRLIWTNEVSLANFRYPTPFPIRAQDWQATMTPNGPVVSFPLGGGSRSELVLKAGKSFHRQLAKFLQLASGDAIRCELSFYPAGKSGKPSLMAKMVGWFAKPPDQPRRGVLHVATDANSLLVGRNESNRTVWAYHADHVPRWSMEHSRRIQRWGNDSRTAPHTPATISNRRAAAAAKYQRRMSTACHEAAAAVAAYADRHRFAKVEYDDATRDFAADFPWTTLERLIRDKCDYHGLEFTSARSGGESINVAITERTSAA